jgi:hypothetical protein
MYCFYRNRSFINPFTNPVIASHSGQRLTYWYLLSLRSALTLLFSLLPGLPCSIPSLGFQSKFHMGLSLFHAWQCNCKVPIYFLCLFTFTYLSVTINNVICNQIFFLQRQSFYVLPVWRSMPDLESQTLWCFQISERFSLQIWPPHFNSD